MIQKGKSMKKRYTALFAAAFALSMIAGCGGNEKADTGATAKAQPAVEQGKGAGLRGEAAPTFTLKNIAGEDVAVEAKGKPYIINFWATWCPPCQAEIPDLAAFYASHMDTVNFYAVNLQEPKDTVDKFLKDNGYTMPVLLDLKGEAADTYKVRAIPTTYVIDRDGKILLKKIGGTTAAELETALMRAAK